MSQLRGNFTAAVVLAGMLTAWPCGGQGAAALTVWAVEGEGAANIISSGKAVRPAVEIRRMDGALIAGASVRFTLPQTGPRAVFVNDTTSATVVSGRDGRAVAPEMRPVGEGSFHITVTVKHSGETALAAITQTNFQNETTAAASGVPRNALSAEYRIEILEGHDGVNIISKKTAVRTILRVVDKNNLPVAAVPVMLAIVLTRGGGESKFPDGNTSVTVLTDAQGRAEAPPVRPQKGGKFEIRVQATVNGAPVTRVISQTNFTTEPAAIRAGKKPGSSAPPEGVAAETSGGPGGGPDDATSAKADPAVRPVVDSPPPVGPKVSVKGGSGGRMLAGALLAGGGVAGAVVAVSQGRKEGQSSGQGQSQTQSCSQPLAQFQSAAQQWLATCRVSNPQCGSLQNSVYAAYVSCKSCRYPGTPTSTAGEYTMALINLALGNTSIQSFTADCR